MAQLLNMRRVTVTRYFDAVASAGLLDGDPSSLPSTEALRAVELRVAAGAAQRENVDWQVFMEVNRTPLPAGR